MLQGILEGKTKASTLEDDQNSHLWGIGQEHGQDLTAAGGLLGIAASHAEGLASQHTGHLQHHCRCQQAHNSAGVLGDGSERESVTRTIAGD